MCLIGLRCSLEALALLGLQAAQAHQPSDPVLTADRVLLPKFTVDAWAAVDLVVCFVHSLDPLVQFLVRHLLRAGRPLVPSVVAARRHIQRLAHKRDREFIPMVIDELESHFLGCEKMVTAFFSMSRSCVKSLTSRSN
jgi:hypothetical protein